MKPNYLVQVFLIALCLLLSSRTFAQDSDKPFVLPMAEPPSAATWLLGQPYGNTIGAYLRGDAWYRAGQRLHFGLDFSMACGTPLVAIGAGTIAFVDDLGFGSAPHNVLIRHDAGYVSLYGHLYDRAPVTPGQRVNAGDLVGYSGDPDLTCDSRPHLHFEIRSLDYQTTYNPVDLIAANWDALTAIGSFQTPAFQQNLDDARRWMQIDDQPDVTFGGRALNLYDAPYPDWRNGTPIENPPLAVDIRALPVEAVVTFQQATFTGCCPGIWWDALNPTRLYGIDGAAGQRASLFAWDVTQPDTFEVVSTAPPPLTSADGTHTITPINENEFAIQRTADGATFIVNTGGSIPSLNTTNTKILFLVTPDTGEERPATNVWVADVDGNNARIIVSFPGTSARWLDDHRLLISTREGQNNRLSVLDTITQQAYGLGAWERLRNLTIAPGGGRLMFYLFSQSEPSRSGIYTMPTTSGATAERLDWFGAWAWRSADSLYYLPFQPDQASQTLRYLDLVTGEDRALTDATTQSFLIANGDWAVSPDGARIAFWNATDDTTWIMAVE